jgi:ribonuclease T1
VSLAAFLLATAVAFQGDIAVEKLPPEARQALTLIEKNGPFSYERDGAVFGNREGLLPKRERGYYREYTVKTPHAQDRGARRIVAGRAGELYYTDDHYRSFRRIIRP